MIARLHPLAFVLLIAVIFTGCSATPEEQALALIQGVGGTVRSDAQGHVVSVDFSETPARDDALAAVAMFPHVQTINCTNASQITGSGLSALRGLAELDTLYLAHTQVDDAGLQPIRHLKALRTLQLGHTKITDTGMPALDSLTGLQTLSIAGTAVSDRGLVQLRDLRNLSTLVLRDTKTTRRGVQELRRMLPDVRVVE